MKYASQLKKEIYLALLLTTFYLLAWVLGAYYSPNGRGIIGFPIWFELTCLYLPLVFTFIIYLAIKYCYKEINLE